MRIVGIFSLFRLIKVFGQISESTNKATEGLQWLINFLIIKLLSIGKNWCEIFLVSFGNKFRGTKSVWSD